jgi:hypothetical protein
MTTLPELLVAVRRDDVEAPRRPASGELMRQHSLTAEREFHR